MEGGGRVDARIVGYGHAVGKYLHKIRSDSGHAAQSAQGDLAMPSQAVSHSDLG